MGERCLLDQILEPGSLSVHFQPVMDVHTVRPKPHYFEALIRGPRGTSAETPAILFEYARKKNRESAVDRACVETILEAARSLPAEGTLGINVHASTLAMDPGFVEFLGAALKTRGRSPRHLVVEVVEHAPPWDVKGFRTALEGLRGFGARIALDDIGLGHSNFMMILECRPDYFEVDRYFVNGCHRDFHRRAVLASVAQLARPFNARVVAEGVEHPRKATAALGRRHAAEGVGLRREAVVASLLHYSRRASSTRSSPRPRTVPDLFAGRGGVRDLDIDRVLSPDVALRR